MLLELKLVLFRSIFVLSYFLKRVWIGLFLLALVGCMQEPELPKPGQTALDQTTQVRAWFEANKGSLRLPARGSSFRTGSQELILPFFEKEPDWDQVHHYFFPDGREVFEVNLENKELFIPSLGEQQQDQGLARRSIQNILFVKHPTEARFDPLIVRYYPDAETSKRDFKDINYQMIDEKWSGTVDLFTYDEHFFIGFEIEKGRILATRKVEVTGESGRRGMGPEQLDIRCSVTTTDWHQISYIKETNTWVVQALSPTRSYSCAVGGPQGEGSGAGGNYAYLPGDLFPNGGGALGSYNPPDVPLPKLTIYIDLSFSSNPTLKCAQEMLSLSEFVNSLTEFTGKSTGKNVTLKVGNTTNPSASAETDGVTFGHNNIIITFNKNKVNNLSSLEAARVLLHEIIHAEIFNAVGQKRGSLLIGNFQHNFEEYKRLYPKNDAQQQHNFMADYIVGKIAKTLHEIHPLLGASEFYNAVGGSSRWPKGINPTFYTAMAWHGLNSTKEWNEMKYEDRKVLQDLQNLDRELTKSCIQ
jgi:hypothetical protein